jgi:signal transduction histidine kinase
MTKYLQAQYWKTRFPQISLFNLLLPLLFSIIFVVLVWHVMQIRFTPIGGSIALPKATLFTDATGICRDSIPDSLADAAVVDKSLPDILTACVEKLKLAHTKKIRAVQIPHEWRKDIKEFPEIRSGKVLYHFEYDFMVKPQGLWAIVLPAVGQNVAVYINDNLIGWSGSFEQPVARNATRPQMFSIPEGELGEGSNEFDLYVVSQPAESGFLDQVYIGPTEMLKPAFNDYYYLRHTLPWTIALTIAVLSIFMLFLWFYRQHETEYGLFALGGFFWLLHSVNQLVVDIPAFWNASFWDSLTYISAGLLALVGIFFIHRLLEKSYPLFEKILLYGGLALLVLVLLVPESWFYSLLFHFANLAVVVAAFYVFALSVIHAFKIKSLEWYALATAMGIIAEFALNDYLMVIGMRPVYKGQYLHFGAPLLLLSFMWILLKRFVDTLQTAERYNLELKALNKNLENRVEARGEKIRQSFETIRELEQEQVLLKERSRIMRDMHDGIGVYLTSILRHLESGTVDKKQLSDAAHNALNDLRLMIDSLGSASTDLPAMLGMFRTRISVALNACNVELEWHVEELPAIKNFGPERALNLLRILQEAFTNALKHSSADCIRLSAYSELASVGEGLIKIEVNDNGTGFRINNKTGNGLKNMQYRAKKIKAELDIKTDSKGTRITIILPQQRGLF